MSEIADSTDLWAMRPKLRHDVVFVESPTGVYLRSADTSFVLKGRQAFRWLSTLAPYLTGQHPLEELCADLEPGHRQTVGHLVRSLTDRGMIKGVGESAELSGPVTRRFASQIEFIDHFTDDAAGRFGRFREATVLVTGGGASLTAVAAGLIRNGCAWVDVRPAYDVEKHRRALWPEAEALHADGVPVELTVDGGPPGDLTGIDALVYCAQDGDLRPVLELARRCHRSGTYFVPAVFTGGRAVLGPVTAPGTAPCWLCAQLRLTTNAEGASGAALWRQIVLGPLAGGVPAVSDVLAGMVGNATAFELFRTVTGALRPETLSAVVIQDLDTLESYHQHVARHPCCPICADAPTDGPEVEVPEPVTDETAYQRAETLVAPDAGVFHSFVDDVLEQSPLKTGRLRFTTPDQPGRPREITAFSTEDVMRARLTACHAAASAYVGRIGAVSGSRRGSAAELRAEGRRPVPWTELTTAAGAVPYDSDHSITWLPARILGTRESADVPAAAVLAFSDHNQRGYVHRTSAGAAAGHTTDDVVAVGLRSALAYASLRAAIEGRAGRVEIPSERLTADSESEFLTAAAGRLGYHLTLYALTWAAPAHAVLAVADRPGLGRPLWTVAGGLSFDEALTAAVRDVVGQAQVHHFEAATADLGDPLFADFDPRVPLATVADTGHHTASTRPVSVDDVVAALADRDVKVLVANTTTSDLHAVGTLHTGTVSLWRSPTRSSSATRADDPGGHVVA